MLFTIDVNGEKWDRDILNMLLFDCTTKQNIIWGTEDYKHLGFKYYSHFPIEPSLITDSYSNVIQPRILKSKTKQGNRTKNKAEVFTPSWLCNKQNNIIDKAWFGRENVFNETQGKRWKTIKDKIKFPDDKNRIWEKYVDERRLEITCGEAPYLVSRYDTSTGKIIPLMDRIGLLDRKMRVISENIDNEDLWIKWAERAFQSIYGFEFQGDSLLIARENLLISYCEYMKSKLNREPTNKELFKIARIISWNIWQMDGLSYTIPYQNVKYQYNQLSLFQETKDQIQVFCKIKDWRSNNIVDFASLVRGGEFIEQRENRIN